MVDMMNQQSKARNILLLTFTLFLLSSCDGRKKLFPSIGSEMGLTQSQEPGVRDYVVTEKSLIPEGTAFNQKTNTIYVGSIYKQKIIGITPEGKIIDIIARENFGTLSPLGMEMDNQTNTLWVNTAVAPIVKHPAGTKRQAAILSFNPSTNELLKKYQTPATEGALLNDLTLSSNGNVYATETFAGNIFMIDKTRDQLELFCELKNYNHPNGIVYFESQNCLFVATDEGIIKIDLSSKAINLIAAEDQINTSTIDGLAIYENYFIGHQSTKVSKFYFDDDISKITSVEIFDSGKELDSSTTGEIGNGYYYYIVNSQIKSGVNRDTKSIKPLDSLENLIIRRKKL